MGSLLRAKIEHPIYLESDFVTPDGIRRIFRQINFEEEEK